MHFCMFWNIFLCEEKNKCPILQALYICLEYSEHYYRLNLQLTCVYYDHKIMFVNLMNFLKQLGSL